MLTTPPPPVDIVAHFEWLREFAASAIRMHPRRAANLPVHVSKMGGLFFWPRSVPWPVCHARDAEDLFDLSRPEKLDELKVFLGHAYELQQLSGFGAGSAREPVRNWISRQLDEVHELARRGRHGHSQPYLPLLQLRREEFSTLPYPADADLFQLLWCPYVHFEGPPNEPPGFLAFWRREADITDPLLVEPPKPDGIELFECRFHAEYITEFPVSASFEAHFREDLDRWHEGGATIYDEMLSAAPGVKLFGYPRWVGEAATPFCICGRMMKILVTIDMDEFGGRGGSVSRWRPVEEPAPDGSHGFSIGDPGALYLFHCPICPGPRLQAIVQAA
jgi:hypothetical protein